MDQGATAVVVSQGERPLELIIALWLDEKLHRSGSERTRRAYADTLADFRRFLHRGGLELDSVTELAADATQAWLGQLRSDGKELKASSRNLKLAILSFFYTFARRRRHLPGIDNPVDLVERSRVQSYAAAVPIERQEMRWRLDQIDRSTPAGLRDYALLLIGVTTGRRLSELAGLRWEHVTFNGTPEHARVTLIFTHAKGGKVMRDTLSTAAAAALTAYRDSQLTELVAEGAPIWVSYSRNGSAGHALNLRTISKLCDRYLGTGKVHTLRHAQPLSAPVLTPTGWRKIGDLHVGDKVIGSDGKPTEVLGVYPQGEQEVVRVHFADGATVDCTLDHLWTVRRGLAYATKLQKRKPQTAFRVCSTREIMDGGPRWNVPVVNPVEFAPCSRLPMDPYTLGALLGDGHFGRDIILATDKAEIEVIARIRNRLPAGHMVSGVPGHYRLASLNGSGRIPVGGNALVVAARTLGLTGVTAAHKTIPATCFTASVEDRRELLRGLMDTDGTATAAGYAGFATISPQLAAGVVSLVRSLGGIASARMRLPYESAKHIAWRVSVRTPFTPFHLQRKVERYEAMNGKRFALMRGIICIEPVGVSECVCIAVTNPDGLYVAQDYVLTHNTFAHDMEKLGAPVSEIQRRLGHSNIATTSRYLAAMNTDENAYAEELAALYT